MPKIRETDAGNHPEATLSVAQAALTLGGSKPNIVLSIQDFNNLLSTVGNTGLCSDGQGVYSVTIGGTRYWKQGHPATPAASSTVGDVSTKGPLIQGFRIV